MLFSCFIVCIFLTLISFAEENQFHESIDEAISLTHDDDKTRKVEGIERNVEDAEHNLERIERNVEGTEANVEDIGGNLEGIKIKRNVEKLRNLVEELKNSLSPYRNYDPESEQLQTNVSALYGYGDNLTIVEQRKLIEFELKTENGELENSLNTHRNNDSISEELQEVVSPTYDKGNKSTTVKKIVEDKLKKEETNEIIKGENDKLKRKAKILLAENMVLRKYLLRLIVNPEDEDQDDDDEEGQEEHS